MTKRMLIDATHKEETRVAVTDGNKLVEYDYESQSRKPIKSSIFLAKVTRVEPSLQAAFVNFGGNRHGFLPFSEIHPDYFRIPVSDREALIEEQEALLKEHDEEEDSDDEVIDDASDDVSDDDDEEPEVVGGDAELVELSDDDEVAVEDKKAKKPAAKKKGKKDEPEKDAEKSDEEGEAADSKGEDVESDAKSDDEKKSDDEGKGQKGRRNNRGRGRGRGRGRNAQYRNKNVEVVGGEDVDDEQRFRFNMRRKYKIQEVIKRGQIMLVQANKEERGNKGAAVGTYLSLPGRYCVLMPNSPRAGGVSRKIANHKDRARMREIMKDIEVPKGMSVIVRTAGVTRTKAEIKRDLDYLMRLWDNIRELTLQSTAPAVVYEEADLIKRSVRDLYTSDVEEILVAGEDGFKIAKSFMKMLIPSHVKKVNFYENAQLPLFNRYQIETQIDEIGQIEVRLKSGGYLVINPTEALVSIDVNSGKSTKGRHIEETAVKTNLEAADEVARQLKLRDLGGLVVIDFIDMEDRRNNAKVERRMKDALSTDRARVQVGRISSFGLMELSRQRLSPSLTEAQYETCKTCTGVGLVRTADAMSIMVLRAIEEEGIRARAAEIIVEVKTEVALYLLNHKRRKLADIENRYGLKALLRINDEIPASEYHLEVSKPSNNAGKDAAVSSGAVQSDETHSASESSDSKDGQKSEKDSNRRRGRRGGRGRNNNRRDKNEQNVVNAPKDVDGNVAVVVPSDDTPDPAQPEDNSSQLVVANDDGKGKSKAKAKPKRRAPAKKDQSAEKVTDVDSKPDEKPAEKEKPARKPRAKKADAEAVSSVDVPVAETPAEEKKPKAKRLKKEKKEKPVAAEYETVNAAPKEKKKGWWSL